MLDNSVIMTTCDYDMVDNCRCVEGQKEENRLVGRVLVMVRLYECI